MPGPLFIDLRRAQLAKGEPFISVRDGQENVLFAVLPDPRNNGLFDHADRINLKNDVPVSTMRLALEKARDTFRHYAELHRAKGTLSGDEKAAANEDMARLMADALGDPS